MRVAHESGKSLIISARSDIAVVGAVLYSNTLHNPFVFDDRPNIQENVMIRVDGLGPGLCGCCQKTKPRGRFMKCCSRWMRP